MEPFSQNFEVLTQRGAVINSKLALTRISCTNGGRKTGPKTFKFAYHVQLAVRILKSGTIISLVQFFFSDGRISEF